MHFLKKLFRFYINASIHVAMAVYAMLWVTMLNFKIPYENALGYIAFCTTVVSYNFMKYGTSAKQYFVVSSAYLKIIRGFSFICFGIAAFYTVRLRLPALLVLALTTVLAMCYALPLLPGRRNFRSLHGLKIYMVALCWSLLSVLLPVIHAKIPFSNIVLIEFTQRFLLVFVLMLPFEIRDLKYDKLSLGTIPQQIGIKKTKWLGILLLLVFYFSGFLKGAYATETMLVNGMLVIVTGLLLLYSKKDQPEYYSSFYVEGIPIVWLCLILLRDSLFHF